MQHWILQIVFSWLQNKIDSKEQLYKNRIAEKDNGSGDISDIMNWRNVYDCYFYVF